MSHHYSRYKSRRQKLLSRLGSLSSSDLVLICAAIEPHARFVQDKNFVYFAGLEEPAAMLCIAGNGHETLFVPNFDGIRAQWVAQELVPSEQAAKELQVDEIRYQGGAERAYSFAPFRRDAQYTAFLEHIKNHLGEAGRLFVIDQPGWQTGTYAQQMSWFLGKFMPQLAEEKRIIDCAPQVAQLRRCKEPYELTCIQEAIKITNEAQKAARAAIVDGAKECEVVAAIQATFTRHSASEAFPSIVATGRNATVLHYLRADVVMKTGDAVVVDIGASVDGYAADITRTYPVGGTFSDRQKEIYQAVLNAQEYIAGIAKPGMWLSNPDKPEQSLNHLVRTFFNAQCADLFISDEQERARRSLAKEGHPVPDQARGDHPKRHPERVSGSTVAVSSYMPHGIGHFMGLDVHDVGDRTQPLAPGDVITIEPGLYIPEEAIGVRIEDDYVITDDGASCLSPQIEKELAKIEG